MKALPTIAAGMLVAFLALAPLLSSAAAATVSVTASPGTLTGSQTVTITGTVTPAPGAGVSAFIQVSNPNGRTVAAASVPVDASAGTFSYSFAAGPGSTPSAPTNWVNGAYTVSATASGATGTTSFTYTGATTGVTAGVAVPTISVQVTSTDDVLPGQSVRVYALIQWVNNGSLAAVSNFPISHYHTGTALTQLGAATKIHIGYYFWTISTTGLADGVYGVHIEANASNNLANGLGAFTVNSAIATSASQQAVLTALNAVPGQITTALGSVTTQLNSILTAANTAASAATAAQTAASGVASNVSNTLSSVQSSQTYVLVIAALAAITLVLELAILVRKLS